MADYRPLWLRPKAALGAGMFRHLLWLVFGVFCCATAVIFIKESTIHPVLLAAYRLFVAAIVLTPLYLRDRGRHPGQTFVCQVKTAFWPGVMLGVHFISWIIGARMTTAVNASLIVNLVPITMPFILYYLVHERVTGRELLGTGIALIGLFMLSAADFNISREYFWGDVLCLGSMLFFSLYLALARRNRAVRSLWLYVVPLYYVAGAFCLGIGLFLTNPLQPYAPKEILLILALGLIPTVTGHSILNFSLKHLRGQLVSIVNMFQFAFAGLMAYGLWGEVPNRLFYAACVLVLAGAVLALDRPSRGGTTAPPGKAGR